MDNKHYVYKITDPKTKQFYFGSRSHKNPNMDSYMGSYISWNPEDESRLVKEIIKDDFKTREDAIEFESNLIEKYIDNELNENYHIPNKGFHVVGLAHKYHPFKTKKILNKFCKKYNLGDGSNIDWRTFDIMELMNPRDLINVPNIKQNEVYTRQPYVTNSIIEIK